MAFIAQNKVRMHDTDMAGILYFPRQFRFVHDALEDLMHHEGLSFEKLFNENDYAFVVVHAEADYKLPLKIGNHLDVHLQVERIGNTSFTLAYDIYRKEDKALVGTAKTVHVAVNRITRTKLSIPDQLRMILQKYV